MSIAIQKLMVPRHERLISQGQSIEVIAFIVDEDTVASLIDPDNIPVVSLINPSGTFLVTDTPMTKLTTGVYSYKYQTTSSNAVGVYTANVTAINAGEVARLEGISVFKIAKTSTLASFSYLAIQDQSSVVWYWYIAGDNTLSFSSSIPVIAGKQAVAISLAVVPSWLEVQNPTPATRYIYPDVDGTGLVSSSQPVVGSGNVGSPTFIGVSGGSFVLDVNIADEIIVNTA